MRRPIGTFESEKAAKAALARVLSDVYQGTYREPETGDVPLREYARRWLATRDLKPSTLDGYERLLRRWIPTQPPSPGDARQLDLGAPPLARVRTRSTRKYQSHGRPSAKQGRRHDVHMPIHVTVSKIDPALPDQPVWLRTEPLLIHFVGRPRGSSAFGQMPVQVGDLSDSQKLSNIAISALIRGFTVPGSGSNRVVSASDISPAELYWAFKYGLNTRGAYSPWAVVLDRSAMWQAGMRPVLYVDDIEAQRFQDASGAIRGDGWQALVVRTSLDPEARRSDWTHEREWRYCYPANVESPFLDIRRAVRAVITGEHGWEPFVLPMLDPAVRWTFYPTYSFSRWYWNGTALIDCGTIDVRHYYVGP